MNAFLAKLPSTNFRIFVGVMLAVILVFYVLAAQTVEGLFEVEGLLLDQEYVDKLKTFILLILGIDATQYIAKRMTYREGVGAPPDGEGATT